MIVIDVETRQKVKDKIVPETDSLIMLGIRDENGNKTFYYKEDFYKAKLKLKNSRVVVGHNLKGYDNIVLEKHGFRFHDNVVVIDTMHILKDKKRAKAMMYLDLEGLGGFGLENLAKLFKLKSFKDEDFDYDILSKDVLSDEDKAYINAYNSQDLEVSYELFKHLEHLFIGFKKYMSPRDQANYSWMTTTVGVTVYKIICHLAGLPEEYDNSRTHKKFKGAYVREPTTEASHGQIFSYDFTSLYPHIMMMINAFSHLTNEIEELVVSNALFKIMGGYDAITQGKIEKVLKRLFLDRLEYKRLKDEAGSLATKIVINTAYGIMGKPAFKSVYNPIGAEDVTQNGVKLIMFAQQIFEENGYKILYGDTDSLYVIDPLCRGREYANNIANSITKTIYELAPFPQETFKLVHEHDIKSIYFFKDEDDKTGKKFLKKFYICVTTDNKTIVKGVPAIVKGDRCDLSKKVAERIMQRIIEESTHKFSRSQVKDMILEGMTTPLLVAKKVRCKNPDYYANTSSLQAQASIKYGRGRHFLIPLKRESVTGDIGIGKGKKYVTIGEFEEKRLWLEMVDTSHVFDDLKYFIKEDEKQLSLGGY